MNRLLRSVIPCFLSVLFCLLCAHPASAQKDAPIAGHAVMLIDLLKKDYKSIDPESKEEEIAKDRALVIGIFKSYLENAKLDSINSQKVKALIVTVDENYQNYLKVKKVAASGSSQNINTSNVEVARLLIEKAQTSLDSVEDLKHKYFRSRQAADEQELEEIFEKYDAQNKFISAIVILFKKKYHALSNSGADISANVNYSTSLQKSIPFIGGNMSYELINGLSQFLAKRIKEELVTYAMENIKAALEKRKGNIPLEELAIILPKTTAYLKTFNAEKIQTFQTDLKGYIENDLNSILENAQQLRNSPRVKGLIEQYPDLDFAFEAMNIIPNLAKVKYPIDYFTILSSGSMVSRWKQEGDATRKNIANLLSFSQMLAHSITIVENGEPKFIAADLWSSYSSEDNFYKLYAGFLYQQDIKYYQISFLHPKGTAKLALSDVLGAVVKDNSLPYKKEFENLITDITKNAEYVYSNVQAIKKANKNGAHIGADTIHNFIKSMISFSRNLVAGQNALLSKMSIRKSEGYQLSDKFNKYFQVAETANEAVFAIQTKKYANGIEQLLTMIDSLMPLGIPKEIPEIFTLVDFGEKPVWKSWQDLSTWLDQSPTAGPDAQLINSFFLEFSKVDGWLQSHSEDYTQDYAKRMSAVRTALNHFRYGTVSDDAIAKEAKVIADLLKDRDFQIMVLSFYTEVPIKRFSVQLESRMKTLRVIVDGKEIRVFDDDTAAQMTKNLMNYAAAYYALKIVKTTNDDAAFKRNQDNLRTDALAYAGKLIRNTGGLDERALSIIHLVNGMALAKDSKDVEKAIESFALPSGSYSIKRSSAFNVSLNSYPGILAAYDFTQIEGKSTSAFAPGFTAPVGLSVAFGNVRLLGNTSLGIFVPLIDIGAVTRLHLDGDSSTETLPELNFKNIFSPGLYLTVGIAKSPFSVNFGGQYGPELKKIGSDINYQSFRLGIGLTIDIPLFNLYTRPSSR